MDSMDIGIGDEMTTIEAINGSHLQSKEGEYTLHPNSSDMLELNEMVIPSECEDKENSPDFFTETLDAINLERIGASENTCASPHCMDDGAGVMVEELTLRSYSSENVAVVGTSNNVDKMQTRQHKWQHLYQIAGASGNGASHGDTPYRGSREEMSHVQDDVKYRINSEASDQNHPNNNPNEGAENLPTNTSKLVSSNSLLSAGGIRTKILSKSGFSEYFVKNTLKGKGVICRRPVPEGGPGVEFRDQNHPKTAGVSKADPGVLLSSNRDFVAPCSRSVAKGLCGPSPDPFHDGVSLREWIESGKNNLSKIKSLYIFRQIVDLVNKSHSLGLALVDLRPSFFKLLLSNEIMYIGAHVKIIEKSRDQDAHLPEHDRNEKRPLEPGSLPMVSQWAKKRKPGENTSAVRRWPQFPDRSGLQHSGNEFNEGCKLDTENRPWKNLSGLHRSDLSKSSLPFASDSSEAKWYASPEELGNKCCTLSSNIYCLGILLFELLCSFGSETARASAMHDLRYRILPPSFLSESLQEAGLCLWLLHPESSSRPTTRDILQSDVMNGIQDLFGNELSASISHEDTESELLLLFLGSLKEQKLKNSSKLVEEIKFIEADIEEVERRQTKKSSSHSSLPNESLNGRVRMSSHVNNSGLEVNYNISTPFSNESRLTRNIHQLESAYFSERANVQHSDSGLKLRDGKELLEDREIWTKTYKDADANKPADCLGAFFKGLCKYARYSKFNVRGILRNGDFNTSANVICSLSFDRDEDYFAAAGVSKKIKIYDFHALFKDSVDIHYPVIELSNKSKLSCTCWNSYIRNYLASTDYDGIVKLWDAGTGQEISQYIEHGRRAWSVDFSQVDPTKLASGSDDCSVKLWNINEKNSLCTIRNIANVCCVQFSAKSSHLVAFGSADYKTYCYDLRNVSRPWCVLAGHDKAVSFVKFLDAETLVSASTDNTLKIWDLNKTSTSNLSTSACISTLRGHANEKNFVGLSVADDGYIVCGSETNEVFAYYRSLPMPITSHKFGSIDPISGKETDDDGGQFVSSVCWRKKSDMVIAANSTGSIKLLQMT